MVNWIFFLFMFSWAILGYVIGPFSGISLFLFLIPVFITVVLRALFGED